MLEPSMTRVRNPILEVLASLALAAAAFASPATGTDDDFGRAASLASRDALLFLSVDDREAFVRRAGATAIGRAIVEYDSEELAELFTLFASEASIFLPPSAMSAFGRVLAAGRGELAVSVEGIVAVRGRVEPEILAMADVSGLEPMLELLSRLAATRGSDDAEDVEDDLDDLELPFAIDLETGVATRTDGDVRRFEFSVVDGARVVVAVQGTRVLVSSRTETIDRALERARNPSFGSLRDSLRFRELWRSLAPGRGSVVAYANLRRMREDARHSLGAAAWAKTALESRLAAFDGVGLALRGVANRFEAKLELERGRSTGHEALLRANGTFAYPTWLPASRFVLALRLDAEQALPWLRGALNLAGNFDAGNAMDAFVADCGGSRVLEPLGQSIGGEFAMFLVGERTSIDTFPRIGVSFGVKDRGSLERTLESLAAAIPERVRRGKLGGETLWSFRLHGGTIFATDPSFVIRDDRVLAATSPNHLRLLLDELARRSPLDRDGSWLSAWDSLEPAPDEPAVAHAFLDAARLSESIAVWIRPLFPAVADSPRLGPLVAELFHALEDPDIHDALGTIALRAESRPSGVRIEAAGP